MQIPAAAGQQQEGWFSVMTCIAYHHHNISGQTIQIFGQNAETETSPMRKAKIMAENNFQLKCSILAKTASFGRNVLFWPKQYSLPRL